MFLQKRMRIRIRADQPPAFDDQFFRMIRAIKAVHTDIGWPEIPSIIYLHTFEYNTFTLSP